MATPKPTFSKHRKWGIALQVGFILCVVFSIAVMVNYLSSAYFHRFHWSSSRQDELSSRTVRFVQSLTNEVKVTIYYDRDEPFFKTIQALLKEYRYVNPRISIETIDYLRDAVAAQRMKTQYKQLVFPTTTNLVIFESGGRCLALDGNALTMYTEEQMPNEREWAFRRRAVAFEGEKMFTSALLAVSTGKPLTAYFLEGHGEHTIMSNDTNNGYTTLAAIAKQNFINPVQLLSLLGSNAVPVDGLLVIAGPTKRLQDDEIEKIDRYLSAGGRLLALFNHSAVGTETGLEKLLGKWGVAVTDYTIRDPGHSLKPADAADLTTTFFSTHPAVNPILGRNWSMTFYEPRCVGTLRKKDSDGFKAEPIAFSSPDAFVEGDEQHKREFPLMVAVEKGDSKGIVGGSTRILVVGDSVFLGNQFIEMNANRNFAEYALNWLLERKELLEGVSPKPIKTHRNLMTEANRTKAEWVMLGGMPGAALLAGGLVWFRRRK